MSSEPSAPAQGSDPGPAPMAQPPQQPHHHLAQQQPQQLPHQPDLAAMKLTRGTSCVLCQQRKVRCDKNKPCANCVKAGVECKVVPPAPPRRRKKRLQEKDLIDRLKKYETLLSEHGVKFDAIGQDLRSDGVQMDDVEELENDFEGLKTSPEASASPSATPNHEKYVVPFIAANCLMLRDPADRNTAGRPVPGSLSTKKCVAVLPPCPLPNHDTDISPSSEQVSSFSTTPPMTRFLESKGRPSIAPLTKCLATQMDSPSSTRRGKNPSPTTIPPLSAYSSCGKYTSTISTHCSRLPMCRQSRAKS